VQNEQEQTTLLRMADIVKIVRLSRPTIYRRIREGKFPAQVKDGRCSMWNEAEVRAYVARILEQPPPAENQACPPKTA
jgi:predicted DNA-binding transcriptional regulator AlpA